MVIGKHGLPYMMQIKQSPVCRQKNQTTKMWSIQLFEIPAVFGHTKNLGNRIAQL